jgi:hypothetical protein
MREYHEVADETMEQLTDTLEAIQEDLADDEFDIEYSVSSPSFQLASACASRTKARLNIYDFAFAVRRPHCQTTGR